MEVFDYDTIDEAYPDVIKAILEDGIRVSPRGMDTRDLGPTTIQIKNPSQKIITNKLRKINPFFMIAEWLWIVTQQNRVDMVGFYNQKMYNYSDDGKILYGAYGPRLLKQIPAIISKIRLDKETRQAVATIYNPRDQMTATKDFPCNIMLHFLPRQGYLDLVVYVRSQDIFLGFPYDFYHWATLLQCVAAETDFRVGTINHICGSLHAYEYNVQKLTEIADGEPETIKVVEPFFNFLPVNITAISSIEFRNRKLSDFTTSSIQKCLSDIDELREPQLIKDQLATLLYYRVRRNNAFDPDKLIEMCGPYEALLRHLEWN